MKQLIKASEELDPRIVKALQEEGVSIAEGDTLIDRGGSIYRVEALHWKQHHYNKDGSGARDVLYIKTARWQGGDNWTSYGDSQIGDFARRLRGENPEYVKFIGSVAELEAQSVDEMLRLETEYIYQDEQQASAGTALTLRHSKEHLEAIRNSIDEKRNRIAVTQRFMERKISRMKDLARGLYKQLQYVTKIIEVGELYLGISEKIYHLRQGQSAPIDTPITFHQLVLYMDEEAGDIEWRHGQQGIDFQSVEAFDEWLIQGGHVDHILPETKGIVFLKPSRQNREYSANPFYNAELKAKNQRAYALIKNGGNVYRIWTELPLGTRLFPSNDEWALLEAGEEEDTHPLTGEKRTRQATPDKVEEQVFSYRRNMALVQGLLDRTEVFQPLPGLINLFDLDSYDGMVRLIRDDEPSLTSGRATYSEWKATINSQIQRGSRVYLAPIPWHYRSDGGPKDRYLIYFRDRSSLPPAPKPGVYSVEEVIGKEERQKANIFASQEAFRILYNPRDEVSAGWGDYDYHERKKRLSFLLYPSDPFVLNYDGLDIDEIEYHISNRRERRQYLDMLPVLHGIRLALIEERAYEQEFARLLHEKHGYTLEAIQKAIEWWKLKNIWKRPIGKDDSKAWRMIKRRLNKQEEG